MCIDGAHRALPESSGTASIQGPSLLPCPSSLGVDVVIVSRSRRQPLLSQPLMPLKFVSRAASPHRSEFSVAFLHLATELTGAYPTRGFVLYAPVNSQPLHGWLSSKSSSSKRESFLVSLFPPSRLRAVITWSPGGEQSLVSVREMDTDEAADDVPMGNRRGEDGFPALGRKRDGDKISTTRMIVCQRS